MRTLGFYHVYLVNHWQEIVMEQIVKIMRSGLYDQSTVIHIGCLGRDEEVAKLREMLKDHKKFVINFHSAVPDHFEFCTLRLLQDRSRSAEPFYAFYIHTKGVTWPKEKTKAYIGGTYWRQYMNYYIISRWKECMNRLDAGHDTCGVKLLTKKDMPAFRVHYSGNFFWCKSTYIRTLPLIEHLRLKDRFQAEFWIGSGDPLCATLCQEFVDYNTQKKWVDPA